MRLLQDKAFPALPVTATILSAAIAIALILHPVSIFAAGETPGSFPGAEDAPWPQAPAVEADAAILMEAHTGTVLYAKNIHDQHYPASTTKIMTALLAVERGTLSDMVEYSADAINSINWREDSNIGIKIGESITLEQSLYGLLVGSGNECGNAIGEHLCGSKEAFVDLMNERARELGCLDTHFANTNGIHNDEHYTTAYDLALIAREFFSYELLCRISNTPDYVIPQSDTLSQELIPFSKNRLLAGKDYAYDGLVGSKTGYTSIAQQNLVSCAQRNGLKLICVVMHDGSPGQFEDTVNLFNYGFSNFRAVNVSEEDARYTIQTGSFFASGMDLFGSSKPLLAIDSRSYIVLPADASYEDAASHLEYDDLLPEEAARIVYSYGNNPVGEASLLLTDVAGQFDFDLDVSAQSPGDPAAAPPAQNGPGTPTAGDTGNSGEETYGLSGEAESIAAQRPAPLADSPDEIIFINVRKVLLWVGIIAAILILLLFLCAAIHNRRLSRRRREIMIRRRAKRAESDKDFHSPHL